MSLFSMDNKVKVICTRCHHTFPASVGRIDPDNRLPQNYPCPVCKRTSKVKVVKGF
ncbi:MAG: hypothetical protein SPI87_11320 [Anaerobutyricum sp.]|nr:hypothetical protein [Eubacterium sp.]MDY6047583.1 hypothetical protein [Anaerobutyricum sp.]